MDFSKLKPTGMRILVKIHENSDTSDGGIYIGQATTTFVNGKAKAVQQTVGEVVAIGTGKLLKNGKRRRPEVEIGDILCFSDTCGRQLDDEHRMINEDDVAFIMEELKTVEIVYEKPKKSIDVYSQ